MERLFHGFEGTAKALEDLAQGLDAANVVLGQAQQSAARNGFQIDSGGAVWKLPNNPAPDYIMQQSIEGQVAEAQQLARQAWRTAYSALASFEYVPFRDALTLTLGTANVPGSLFAGGEYAWAARQYWTAATGGRDQMARLLAMLQDESAPAGERAGAALQIFNDYFRNRQLSQAALTRLNAGGLPETLDSLGKGLGALAVIGDAATLWKPDGTGVEAAVNRDMAGINAAVTIDLMAPPAAAEGAGMAAGGVLADANVADEVPYVGWGIAITTGLYLTGDFIYHHHSPSELIQRGTPGPGPGA